MGKHKTLMDLRSEKMNTNTPNALATGYFSHRLKVKKPSTAAQLENLIAEYTSLSGGFSTNIYSGGRERTSKTHVTDVIGRKNSITETKYLPSVVMKGHSDMIISYKGYVLYLEIKLGKDRQSEAQKIFQQLVESKGSPYRIVHTLGEYEQLFTKFMNHIDNKNK
jgi:hypothetical protein